MPSPSYWPLVVAVALPIMAYGVIYSRWLIVIGFAIAMLGIYGWALEPATATPDDYEPPPPPSGGELEVATHG